MAAPRRRSPCSCSFLSFLLKSPPGFWKERQPPRSPGLKTLTGPYQKKSSESSAEESMAKFSLQPHVRASVMGGLVGPQEQEPFTDNEESPVFIPGKLLGLSPGK